MCQRSITLAIIALTISGATVWADCGCGAQPVYTSAAPSYSTYYAPATADYAPVSQVSYYAPVAAPMPYVSYYVHGTGLCPGHLRHLLCAARCGRALRDLLCASRGLCPCCGALPGFVRGAGQEHLRDAPRLRAS